MAYTIDQLRGAWGAGHAAGVKKVTDDPLVGLYAHSKCEDGRIRWQCHILAKVSAGVYKVQLFGWLLGEPTKQVIVRVDDMQDWDFYESADQWRAVGDKVVA